LVANETVDEDIFEMGERKRKLSHAILSDERKNKTDSGSKHCNDDDNFAIGNILQRALQRRSSSNSIRLSIK
jgi:hypothetical protein